MADHKTMFLTNNMKNIPTFLFFFFSLMSSPSIVEGGIRGKIMESIKNKVEFIKKMSPENFMEVGSLDFNVSSGKVDKLTDV